MQIELWTYFYPFEITNAGFVLQKHERKIKKFKLALTIMFPDAKYHFLFSTACR